MHRLIGLLIPLFVAGYLWVACGAVEAAKRDPATAVELVVDAVRLIDQIVDFAFSAPPPAVVAARDRARSAAWLAAGDPAQVPQFRAAWGDLLTLAGGDVVVLPPGSSPVVGGTNVGRLVIREPLLLGAEGTGPSPAPEAAR